MAGALDSFQLLFDAGDALRDDAAVGLDLGFTGATQKSKTAALPLEVGPRPHQAAALIGQVREFDLEGAFAGAGALPEYFENEAGTVEHLGVPGPLQVALLHRGERAIHHHQTGVEAFHQTGELLYLAFSDEGRGRNLA